MAKKCGKKRQQRNERYLRRKQAFAAFPRVTYAISPTVPQPFAAAVQKTMVRLVELTHHALSRKRFEQLAQLEEDEFDLFIEAFLATFPENTAQSYRWFCSLFFEATRGGLTIRLRAMNQQATPDGCVYFWDGQLVDRKQIAFTEHALRRLQDRLFKPDARTDAREPDKDSADEAADRALFESKVGDYMRWNVAHGMIRALNFRPVPKGDVMALYLTDRWSSHKKLAEITGLGKDLAVLRGYCPTHVTDQLTVAKTFLTPGMRHTPERDWYERQFGFEAAHSDLARLIAEPLEELAQDAAEASLLKTLHENVFPIAVDS